jgi:hypothetical protein
MGKKIIIKGADFSANALTPEVLPEKVDITSKFTIVGNRLAWFPGTTSSNTAGNPIGYGVDISIYISLGYSSIIVTRKSEKWILKGNTNNQTMSGTDNNCVYANDSTGQSFDQSSYSGTINSSYPYLFVGLLMSQSSTVYTGSTDLSQYVKIELSL